MHKRYSRRPRRRHFLWQSAAGFTLVELLVVIALSGILAGILAPGWLSFQTVANLNAAQDGVLQAIRQAQVQAINQRQNWRVGFRETNAQVEWSLFSTAAAATGSPAAWQQLRPGVRIASDDTTLSQSQSIYFVEFNDKGNVVPPFGRLSLASSRGGHSRRCVVVSTLLGLLRKATDSDCLATQAE